MQIVSTAAAAAFGAAAWTLAEYASHRWLLHAGTTLPVGRLHRAHHREPAATSPLARAAGHVGVAAASLAVGATLPLPRRLSGVAAAAFAAGYSTYETSHWRIHHRPPRGSRGAERRRRHLRHHHGAPAGNHGVTSGFWDRRFGTELDGAVARVPARLAPSWADTTGFPVLERIDG